MKNLLLPYAFDSAGNLVHIECARKGETYMCPECGEHFTLNISKIPEGEKYHRRNHFSHPKGCLDNHCSESFLHKLFKERAIACIKKKLDKNEKCFDFVWYCEECYKSHKGNMFKKATSVCLEYDLGICRPDIALLDINGEVVIVIEIVCTHNPDLEVIKYYNNNRIGCLQINVTDFEDCERVEEKLTHPDKVNLCPIPNCKNCGHKIEEVVIKIKKTTCEKCNKEMIIATKKFASCSLEYNPKYFYEKEVELANENGTNIKKKYITWDYANICKHCSADFQRYDRKSVIQKELNVYGCHHCVELKRWKEEAKRKKNEAKMLDETIKSSSKVETECIVPIKCPKCQCELKKITENNKCFYRCGNHPNCDYEKTNES